MDKKKLGTKEIRKYWKDVFVRAFEPVWGELAMRALFVLFFLVLAVLIISSILTLLGNGSVLFLEGRVEHFKAVLSTSFWTFLVMVILITVGMYRAAAEIHYDQERVIQQKTEEANKLEASLQAKELSLAVYDDNSFYFNNANGDIIPSVCIDVVNLENRKIVEMDAHLTMILQWTESQVDRTSPPYSYHRNMPLVWEGGGCITELLPGLNSRKKLRIAKLNCTTNEFSFVDYENLNIPMLQQGALYRIYIEFKGKLEGNDLDFRFYRYETEFICSPADCICDFVPQASENRNLPIGLRNKIFPPIEREKD